MKFLDRLKLRFGKELDKALPVTKEEEMRFNIKQLEAAVKKGKESVIEMGAKKKIALRKITEYTESIDAINAKMKELVNRDRSAEDDEKLRRLYIQLTGDTKLKEIEEKLVSDLDTQISRTHKINVKNGEKLAQYEATEKVIKARESYVDTVNAMKKFTDIDTGEIEQLVDASELEYEVANLTAEDMEERESDTIETSDHAFETYIKSLRD